MSAGVRWWRRDRSGSFRHRRSRFRRASEPDWAGPAEPPRTVPGLRIGLGAVKDRLPGPP